jgi:protocatechuate 3,4-dioxygenase alpha subunit
MSEKLIPTPSQTVGPFFHLGLDRPEWSDLTRTGASGERIAIEGRIIDGDGAAVPDGFLELWQADAAGRYAHGDDPRSPDPGFPGFGRVMANDKGAFRFLTIRPGPVPGGGNSLQAPHIAVAIFARGLLKQLYTRIYFADERANELDPVLTSIEDPAARKTLLAERQEGRGMPTYRFDIVLQGPGETVFFDL